MDLVLTALAVQLANLAIFVWLQRSTLTRTLALWHQLVVYKRQIPHPAFKNRDRLLWVLLSRLWPKDSDRGRGGWRRALVIVSPADPCLDDRGQSPRACVWSSELLSGLLRLPSQAPIGFSGRTRPIASACWSRARTRWPGRSA